MALEPMPGKCASSYIDLEYTNIFCIPEVTSEFFSSCDRVLGYYIEFNQEYRGSLRVLLGTRNSCAGNAGE